ncbi:hypothetical protein [Desulfurococcus mucosus]|uniref:Uncharacterized protein n=1 Tax=Desulfurococcus mucosus (strain ATCC 35584 / DSM 2162 / JCM 9187 / O7/1) TaxID=765177 RepID=E8R7I7_DESM0|nr:hypothetical protein [Desulfurococcus mucosus]ADV64482.1 hypothetical protein Desmu_0163 [Desulfurococcus mucosus DSM 2162]
MSLRLDLSEGGGCSDNPLSRLIAVLKEGVGELEVKTRSNIIPRALAEMLGDKYGYKVEVSVVNGEEVVYLFKRKQ